VFTDAHHKDGFWSFGGYDSTQLRHTPHVYWRVYTTGRHRGDFRDSAVSLDAAELMAIKEAYHHWKLRVVR
jgi:hypothetical protein